MEKRKQDSEPRVMGWGQGHQGLIVTADLMGLAHGLHLSES